MGAYRIYSTSGGPTKGWEQSSKRQEIPELPKDHLSVAGRAPWLHYPVSRFPAEAAPTSTDLRWSWLLSEDPLPFNQKLSTTIAVKLHSSAVTEIFF